MQELYEKINQSIKNIKKEKKEIKSIFVGFFMVVLLLPIAGFLLFLICIILINMSEMYIGNAIMALVLVPWLALGGFTIILYLWREFRSDIKIILLYSRLDEFTELFKDTTTRIENFNSILDGTESIYKILSDLPLLKRYIYSKDSKYLFLQRNTIEYLSLVLKDIRNDLCNQLSKQQKDLESAKSEVERNISGTTELEQVSELQKVRLDRQIEQFEELQRVLVKM